MVGCDATTDQAECRARCCGYFQRQHTLEKVGFTCAFCHSTVDNFVAPGIGKRIDGLGNRDLNVGAIISTAPNLQPVVDLLRLAPQDANITVQGVRDVLNSWARPIRCGVVPGWESLQSGAGHKRKGTGTNVSGATLMPNARGLPGHNLHTWTGGWGTVTYWNSFVAVEELHGIGTSFDERFDDATQFPIAAAAKLGHFSVDPDSDQLTGKLAALHFYQLALPAVQPRPGIAFDPTAAARGDELFSDRANCNSCYHEPLWTEPAKPGIRSSTGQCDRTSAMNLGGGLQKITKAWCQFWCQFRFVNCSDEVQLNASRRAHPSIRY